MKLKKLRKHAAKLSYLVEIAEQEARLAELRRTQHKPVGFMSKKKVGDTDGWKTKNQHASRPQIEDQ